MRRTQRPTIFNRRHARMRRERSGPHFENFDFLHRRAMLDVVDRLETTNRDFPRAVFIGAGELISLLTPACGVEKIYSFDAARGRLPDSHQCLAVADEEFSPVGAQKVDLIVSILTLHAVNDPVGAMTQARLSLKPDGLFIAAIFGEATLSALRKALYQAESELTGGVSARIFPFAAIQDLGQALARAGFALPVVDIDKISVRYGEPPKLLKDIQGMGESNALYGDRIPLRRDTLVRAMEIFAKQGGEEKFEIIYATGWAPHESQQKPLRPGSAKFSLKETIKKNY